MYNTTKTTTKTIDNLFEGDDFIIVDGRPLGNCRVTLSSMFDNLPSDFYSINSYDKQLAISKVAYENNIDVKGWIGLSDELTEGRWLWVDGSPVNNFYFWRRKEGKGSKEGSKGGSREDKKDVAVIRFDYLGYGWDSYEKNKENQVIICSHRLVDF